MLLQYSCRTSGLYSSYMTVDGEAFEFNPVTEVFDPNMDAGCNTSAVNAAIQNLTAISSIKRAFWFHRPCSDIVVSLPRPVLGIMHEVVIFCFSPNTRCPIQRMHLS